MRIECESVLDRFRGPGRCELCGKHCRAREPHHHIRKGMGGGATMDVSINLVAVGVAFQCDCHRRTHDGNAANADVLAAIAKRERAEPEEIEESLWVLQRLRKGCSWLEVEEQLAEVSERVAELVRRSLIEVGYTGG